MNESVYRFKVGDFDCVAVLDYYETGTITEFFPNEPEELLRQKCLAHGYNPDALDVAYICLAVQNGVQWTLLDAGNGPFADRNGQLIDNLAASGITPDDCADIVLTHLNADHYGGLTDADGNRTFPNSKIWIWEEEWKHWTSETVIAEREKLFPGAAAFCRKHLLSLEPQVAFIRQEGEILPGIRVIATPGHTVGHLVIAVESAGEVLLFIGDAFVIPLMITCPEWKPVFDWHDPDQAIETRKRMARMAVERDALVHGFHFPFPGLGYIRWKGDMWLWEPVDYQG